MKMLPASAGLHWLRQGFALFARQPGALSLLFVLWMFGTALVTLLPRELALACALFLMALYPPSMMLAYQRAANGERVSPMVFRDAFKGKRLLAQGVLAVGYLLLGALAFKLMLHIAGDVLVQLLAGKADMESEAVRNSAIPEAVLAMMAVSAPSTLVYWFATTLVNWNGAGVIKALFFTVVSVWRGLKAFIVFAAGLFMLNFAFSALVMVLSALTGAQQIVLSLLLPMVATIVQCALYAAYMQLIGPAPTPSIDTTA
ncbi:BPSS1780 family membrane protein [Massilia sp. TS11]|uniref:BPSS1780 family membrane protein n=1 Tax=Massilia sp. TS11 TaxID=2908003 RepID=UPI001EDB3B12|nr:BPSS1780 family membrane protein [Massilia sp. TS11]MCG2585404.1 hypothetical protein [Massilia sp. TS11]